MCRRVQVVTRASSQRKLDPVGQLGNRKPAVRKVAPKYHGNQFPVTIPNEHQ